MAAALQLVPSPFVEDDIDGVIINDIDDVGLGTLQSRLKLHSFSCLWCFEASLGFDTESVDRELAYGEQATMSRVFFQNRVG